MLLHLISERWVWFKQYSIERKVDGVVEAVETDVEVLFDVEELVFVVFKEIDVVFVL